MSSIHRSVTFWMKQVIQGKGEAAQPLWERYYGRLIRLARLKMGNVPRAAIAEEDVALSAFDSFCRGIQQGRFPRMDDRHDLWQVLLMITARKACDVIEHEQREKRDWRRRVGLEAFPEDESGAGFHPVSPEPDPALAAQVAEECQRLLTLLKNDELRHVAVARMEGYTTQEIAQQLGCALSSIERQLRLIRRTWEAEIDNSPETDHF